MGAIDAKCCSRKLNSFVIMGLVLLLISISHGLNLGLIAGDLKRHSSPLIIKRISKLSPVFININRLSKSKPTLSLPNLPPKPPPLKLSDPITQSSRKLPRSILPPLLLPKLPLLPFLPILPPVLSPLLFLSKIPLLPILPPLPLLPSLKKPLKPLRVPILGKLKALGSELKEVKVPPVKIDNKDDILRKLLDLKKTGSLTTPEFLRFKKLLLK